MILVASPLLGLDTLQPSCLKLMLALWAPYGGKKSVVRGRLVSGTADTRRSQAGAKEKAGERASGLDGSIQRHMPQANSTSSTPLASD